MSPDDPIDLVPTDKALSILDRPDLALVAEGDTVRVGDGRRAWLVERIWQPALGGPVAACRAVDSRVLQTYDIRRLTVLEKSTP